MAKTFRYFTTDTRPCKCHRSAPCMCARKVAVKDRAQPTAPAVTSAFADINEIHQRFWASHIGS
jgi:hypothetical protein